jgi:DNA repair protein RadC
MNTYKSIRHWAEDDKPREKFLNKGKDSLSNAELIAILLGTGHKQKSAVDLGRDILQTVENELDRLAEMDAAYLQSVQGVGAAKAVTILAAIELGRRCKSGKIQRRSIQSARDVYDYLGPVMEDLSFEEFRVLLLDNGNRVIKESKISDGGSSGTLTDPRKIFSLALQEQAKRIILCHNHPSGALYPSQADINITNKLKEGGKILEIPVLDHVIIGRGGYYSFADEGKL